MSVNTTQEMPELHLIFKLGIILLSKCDITLHRRLLLLLLPMFMSIRQSHCLIICADIVLHDVYDNITVKNTRATLSYCRGPGWTITSNKSKMWVVKLETIPNRKVHVRNTLHIMLDSVAKLCYLNYWALYCMQYFSVSNVKLLSLYYLFFFYCNGRILVPQKEANT